MPYPDGKLSDVEVALADANLKLFWQGNGGRRPCPTCGSQGYHVINQLNGNRSDTLGPEPYWRFPTVMVTCAKCGYLEQYLATSLGINWLLPAAPAPTESALSGFDEIFGKAR